MVVHEIVCAGKCEHSAFNVPEFATLIPAPDDRVQHLLRSNESPLSPEEKVVRRQVAEAEAILVQFQTRMTCLKHELKRLRSQRHNLKELVAPRKAILSPIRRLPSELVTTIMHYALEPEDHAKPRVTLDMRKGPWPLTQICSRWRSIAVSLPTLWSRIQITADDIRPTYTENLETILHRSKNHPLHISVTFPRPSALNATLVDLSRKLLGVLVIHSHRWRVARLIQIPAECLPELYPVVDRIPLLEEIYLAFCINQDRSQKTTIDCLAKSPKLQRACIMNFPGDFKLLRIPWSQLVTLKVFGCSLGDEFHILRRLRRIESLEFELTDVSDEAIVLSDHDHDQVTELPHLYRFLAEDWDTFGWLNLPALKLVGMQVVMVYVESLISLVHRSSCTLTTLSLLQFYEASEADTVVSLLQTSPTISTLRIYNSPVYLHAFMDRLMWSPQSEHNILPQLKRLSVEIECDAQSIEQIIQSLVQIVLSRRVEKTTDESAVSAKLNALNFETNLGPNFSKEYMDTLVAQFDVLRGEDMNLFINLSSDFKSSDSAIIHRLHNVGA